jgi:PPOX class probable F420-dependent enzyme
VNGRGVVGGAGGSTDAAPARRGTRPVPGRRVPGFAVVDRVQPRLLRSQRRNVPNQPAVGTLDAIAGRKNALVVTFRRDGSPVATPVWAALAGGRIFVRSERASGKVTRLRRRPHALIAPSTRQGRAVGPPLEVTGRVLAGAEEFVAERALRERYGLGRDLFERTMDILRVDMAYLEFAPLRDDPTA